MTIREIRIKAVDEARKGDYRRLRHLANMLADGQGPRYKGQMVLFERADIVKFLCRPANVFTQPTEQEASELLEAAYELPTE